MTDEKKTDKPEALELEKAIQWVDSYEEATKDERDLSEKCRDYYDHKQWTAEEIRTFEKRKQPTITNNQISKKVDFLIGMEQHLRTDPKAFARTPAHQDTAEAATDALRYVADNNDYQDVRSENNKCLLLEGTAAVEVIVEKTNKGFDIKIDRLGS